MRGRVNPVDSTVWVCGVKGWHHRRRKDGCLQRVRYTGKPFVLPTEMHVKRDGIRLTFPVELDPDDRQRRRLLFDGGLDVSAHGEVRLGRLQDLQPNEKGRDTLDVSAVELSATARPCCFTSMGSSR